LPISKATAAEWRKEWNGKTGRPALARMGWKLRRTRLLFRTGVPATVANTKPLGSQANPNARHSSRCRTRWAPTASTATSGRVRVRTDFSDLGSLKYHPLPLVRPGASYEAVFPGPTTRAGPAAPGGLMALPPTSSKDSRIPQGMTPTALRIGWAPRGKAS